MSEFICVVCLCLSVCGVCVCTGVSADATMCMQHRGVETSPEVARGEGSGEGVDALSYQTRLDQSRGCKGCFEVDIS